MSSTSNKRAPTTATQRLKQDYLRIKKDPVPYICAEPLPSNILEWHYVVRGPEMTPYEGIPVLGSSATRAARVQEHICRVAIIMEN
ncbi:UBE2J2 isoform 6 [Pongo abelii]|uniref:UBE2J2 isoform 6 n=1 Tax=Pongo abelii TaxID=9601 RepID=A0A2J8R783_PONAB|nr:UBE2J2 isoform 6 [Pongo abelii]